MKSAHTIVLVICDRGGVKIMWTQLMDDPLARSFEAIRNGDFNYASFLSSFSAVKALTISQVGVFCLLAKTRRTDDVDTRHDDDRVASDLVRETCL